MQCPVCERSVSGNIEIHVERCLRRASQRSSASYAEAEGEVESSGGDEDPGQAYIPGGVDEYESDVEQLLEDGEIRSEDDAQSRKRRRTSVESLSENTVNGKVKEKTAYQRDDWEANVYRRRMRNITSENTATDYGAQVNSASWERLFDYQREGVKWLYQLYEKGQGGILGDEMGLGKTVQLAAHFQSLVASDAAEASDKLFLIVCPATLLQHWLKELHTWAASLRVVIMHAMSDTFQELQQLGPGRITRAIKKLKTESQGVVVIITFEGLRLNIQSLASIEWTAVCLDEGQKIRNPDAEITTICKRLRAFHRIILSGTPIQNSLKELWSLVDFIYPGKLGTLEVFENEISKPIREGGYRNANKFQAELSVRTAQALQMLIRPHLLRRKKEDLREVTSLTAKSEKILFCRLTPKQRRLYLEIIDSKLVHSILRRCRTHSFKALSLLRKLCNHPEMVAWKGVKPWEKDMVVDGDEGDGEEEEDGNVEIDPTLWEDSGKLLILSKLLVIWKQDGDKVLIFSQTQSMLNLVEYMLNQYKYRYLRLDGSTPVHRRENIISTFNNDETVFIMLLTTKTGGVGISLTAANRVVLMDPDWNPQTDCQARERSWRIGQKRDVVIYRLITKGTIEEKIYERQIFKLLLSNRILQNPKQKALFARNDFKELFELRDADVDDFELPSAGAVSAVDVKAQPLHTNDSANSQDYRVLQALFDGSSVCSVYDHNFLEAQIMTNIINDANNRAAQEVVEKAKKKLLESGAASSAAQGDDSSIQYSVLQRLREIFETERLLTSQQIIQQFGDISREYAPVFREMLRRVATLSNGKWVRNY